MTPLPGCPAPRHCAFCGAPAHWVQPCCMAAEMAAHKEAADSLVAVALDPAVMIRDAAHAYLVVGGKRLSLGMVALTEWGPVFLRDCTDSIPRGERLA